MRCELARVRSLKSVNWFTWCVWVVSFPLLLSLHVSHLKQSYILTEMMSTSLVYITTCHLFIKLPQTWCSYLGWFSVWHLAVVLGEVEVLMSLKQRSRGVPSVLSLSSIPPNLWGTSECPRHELLTPELLHPWHTHILSLGSLKRLVNMASICFATIKLFRTNSCWWLLEGATLRTLLEVCITDIDANCSMCDGTICFQFRQFPEQSYFPLFDLKCEEWFTQNCKIIFRGCFRICIIFFLNAI